MVVYETIILKVQLYLSVQSKTKKCFIVNYSCIVLWWKQDNTMNDKKEIYLWKQMLSILNYIVERDESFPVKIELIFGAVSVYFEKTYRTSPNA